MTEEINNPRQQHAENETDHKPASSLNIDNNIKPLKDDGDNEDEVDSEDGGNYNNYSGDDDDYDTYGTSGEKYGWYNGWSDDVIDDAFEGDPENTWNVD